MKILILKFRNIGDVLLITPLLSNLKQHYPEAKIDVAINKETEPMLSLNPDINKIVAHDRDFIKSLPLIKKLIKEIQFTIFFRKKHYDMVINLTEGDRGVQIAWLAGASVRIGYPNKNWILKNAFTHYLPKQAFRHTLETNLDPLKVLDIPINNKKVEIFWDKDDESLINDKMLNIEQFIHIHPVSRWLFKCIADQTMAEIIDYCEIVLNTKVIITAAPVQTELVKVNSILKLCQSNPINLSGELSLKQTATLNKKAKLFIGVDTAIMHISAANDIPTLAIFGPSSPDSWGSWSNDLGKAEYFRQNGTQINGSHRVVSSLMKCVPCSNLGCNNSQISDCMLKLGVSCIKKNINEMIV